MTNIHFIDHSGFLIELEEVFLVFDFFQDSPSAKQIQQEREALCFLRLSFPPRSLEPRNIELQNQRPDLLHPRQQL